jgi:magnesium chelatase family protein
VLARTYSFAIDGVHARVVCVELDIRPGLPAFNIVGMSSRAVRDTRERVRAAVLNAGYSFPRVRVTANLAPADLEKSGPGFDLALACGVLTASEQLGAARLERTALFAEVSLSGELRPCRGALAAAEGARRAGMRTLIVAAQNAAEAAQVDGLTIAGLASLREAAQVLDGTRTARVGPRPQTPPRVVSAAGDLADVRGQGQAVNALMVAAAGGHHMMLSGPPGVGKTMLARRLPSIMAPLARREAIEVTKIHSVAGVHHGGGLLERRPFRAPHHTISSAGLVGGGPLARPGEAVLAHLGVLFLDELSEFSRPALDALRQPLEDKIVAIVRRQNTAIYPTRFMLVAATNPCPCGYAGEEGRCKCAAVDLARHRRKLSGPLLDRLEIRVALRRPSAAELRVAPALDSAAVAARVLAARARQRVRLKGTPASCNGELDLGLLHSVGNVQERAEAALNRAYDQGTISARGHVRVLRVARTVADLDGEAQVKLEHVQAALGLHSQGQAT